MLPNPPPEKGEGNKFPHQDKIKIQGWVEPLFAKPNISLISLKLLYVGFRKNRSTQPTRAKT
jgi:hypothetical protein